jgi:hypothetical protein
VRPAELAQEKKEKQVLRLRLAKTAPNFAQDDTLFVLLGEVVKRFPSQGDTAWRLLQASILEL